MIERASGYTDGPYFIIQFSKEQVLYRELYDYIEVEVVNPCFNGRQILNIDIEGSGNVYVIDRIFDQGKLNIIDTKFCFTTNVPKNITINWEVFNPLQPII